MLTIENLVKTFSGERARRLRSRRDGPDPATSGRILAVNDISLEVREGEMFTLLGPSGCGKTTTLRSVAGLERPDSGVIRLGDKVLFSGGHGTRVHVPTNRRGLGMVFQSYAIWPHMKVFDNVAFPLQVVPRQTRLSRKEIRERVMRTLETMELADYAERHATKLSGGQQQRLALARALVTEPDLILLDEPLSNLDAKLRESMRFELKRFQRELGITSVYVTHDQVEALALSSRIAVIRDGQVMQVGTPREIYERPANRFVAEFIGTSNFIEGKVMERKGEYLVVRTDHGPLTAQVADPVGPGTEVVLAVRPEGVRISAGPATGAAPNEWSGEVVTRSYLGDSVDHIVRVGNRELLARTHSKTSIAAGTGVTIQIDPPALSVIPVGS